MTVAGIVLAAGASRRFGTDDKLLAKIGNRPLAALAALAMSGASVDHRIAVVATDPVAAVFEGFDVVRLPTPAHQSDSLRAGLARAEALGADRIVVSLGDMPFVTAETIDAVLERAPTAAVSDGRRRSPPAAFPAKAFPELHALSGDRGAGALLARLPESALVRVPANFLTDVDTPEALDALSPPR